MLPIHYELMILIFTSWLKWVALVLVISYRTSFSSKIFCCNTDRAFRKKDEVAESSEMYEMSINKQVFCHTSASLLHNICYKFTIHSFL